MKVKGADVACRIHSVVVMAVIELSFDQFLDN